MRQVTTIVPDNIRQRYPTHQELMTAIDKGEVLRDQYGNLIFPHQAPFTDTQSYPPNYGYLVSNKVVNNYNCGPSLLFAKPIDNNMIEFEMFNIEAVRYYKEKQTRLNEKTHNDYREFTDTLHCFTSTEIAKDYGMSAQILHQVLHSLGILYHLNGSWQLYSKIAEYGYTTKNENGNIEIYWTADGRDFINRVLRSIDFKENTDNKEVISRLLN